MAPKAYRRPVTVAADHAPAQRVQAVPRDDDDAVNQQAWPDRLTVTRNSGVDYYYEQYRRLLVREESLLKERETLRRANAALRSRLSSSASVPPLQVRSVVSAGLVS
jgi:hypothetical protein